MTIHGFTVLQKVKVCKGLLRLCKTMTYVKSFTVLHTREKIPHTPCAI